MRPLITTAAIVVSLALAGTSAFAADSHLHKKTRTHLAHAHVAQRHFARGARPFDVGQFIQSIFGGTWPTMNVRLAHPGRANNYPTYSSSTSPADDSPPVNVTSTADDTAARIQEMNNQNAMLQSMQAAQQQNDEANAAFVAGMAAALQTEINANNQ